MKKDVIATLTQYELSTMVTSAVRLLQSIDTFDSDKTLAKSLKQLMVKAFAQEQEHYCEAFISSPTYAYGDRVTYCLAYKIIGDCKYYSNGEVTFDFFKAYLLPSWEPKDPKVVKKIQKNTDKYRQKLEHNSSAEEMSQQKIEETDREFWKELNKVKYLYMKYQMCKFTKKNFKVTKRFLIGKKTIWQFVHILKAAAKSKKDIRPLKDIVVKSYYLLQNLFQASGHTLSINQFASIDDLSNAYRQRSLVKPFDVNSFRTVERYWSSQTIKIDKDPDTGLNRYDYFSPGLYLIDWVYSLQKLADNNGLDPELKEFLEVLGIIRKEDDNK